jgi:hypothetical protein
MKYAVAALLGILLGAAGGLAGLYYNPLTEPHAPEPNASDWVLRYTFPVRDPLMVTHGMHARVLAKPQGVHELWENTISATASIMLTLNDGAGAATALASRSMLPSASTDFLLRGAVLTDHWVLTVPGQGSLFLQVDSNVWPFVKDSLVPVWYLGRQWRGPIEYRPTDGPGARGAALVIGATGRFAELQGSAVERYELREFSRAGAEELVGELYVRLVEPLVAANQ